MTFDWAFKNQHVLHGEALRSIVTMTTKQFPWTATDILISKFSSPSKIPQLIISQENIFRFSGPSIVQTLDCPRDCFFCTQSHMFGGFDLPLFPCCSLYYCQGLYRRYKPNPFPYFRAGCNMRVNKLPDQIERCCCACQNKYFISWLLIGESRFGETEVW